MIGDSLMTSLLMADCSTVVPCITHGPVNQIRHQNINHHSIYRVLDNTFSVLTCTENHSMFKNIA